MPYASISEDASSRTFTVGSNAGRELLYTITGTDDDAEVYSALVDTSPTTYLGLRRETINAKALGGGVWKGTVRYAGSLDTDAELTFDTTGGSQRITQSIATVGSYAPPYETAPNFQGAIGVTDDRVEGTEIGSGKYSFTETHRFTRAQVDLSYRLILRALTFTFNNAPFRGFAAGEVLFEGAFGSVRGDDLWSLTFKFAASPNVSGLTIGGTPDGGPYGDPTAGVISGIDKLGWDYIWVMYADFEDESAYAIVKRPVAAYVERVYFPANFALLGIGTDPLD